MLNDKMLFYNNFAEQFDKRMNMYETNRRLEIIFENLLLNNNIKNAKLLDAGCGTGWFSKKAYELGADVVSMDLGENLLSIVKKKCNSQRVIGSILDIPFDKNTFDYVICTEVIEHTVNPKQAVKELSRVLKPGGILILTVPNKIWKWSVIIANALKIRPYEGFENWVGYYELKKWIVECNFVIEEFFGFNLIPIFSRVTMPINKKIDKFCKFISPLMINIGLKARKI